MSAATGLAKIIDEPRQWGDRALRFLRAREITVEAGVHQIDHEFGGKAGEANQGPVSRPADRGPLGPPRPAG